jgi:predicted methyltransferase
VRVPLPHFIATLRALRDAEFLEPEGARAFQLTPRGEHLARELGAHAVPNTRCAACEGSATDWRALDDVYARYLAIFQVRPRRHTPARDQGAMTPESLFRRLALMYGEGDVVGKNIAALGDGDLASLALGLTGLPRQVTVLEWDETLCQFIREVAAEHKLKIEVIRQDLTQNLPARLRGTMDTFVCDPPETEAGLLLFVEKGLVLLTPGEAHVGYFGVTTMGASGAKWRHWQQGLLDNHAIFFSHILPPFTVYEGGADDKPLADLRPLAQLSARPWYRSAFYRLETLPDFIPAPDFETGPSDVFYFDGEGYHEAFKD